MSDWQVGDLALCVDENAWFNLDGTRSGGPDPQGGQIYTVTGLADCPVNGFCLWLHGFVEDSYCAESFRKIRPDEHEACDPEFVEVHLKRSKVRA